ncbi:hypothetical protein [Streptomyces sp. NPDC052042]|uniref:hypothetical protein n=1 Tax=Streptomyces sp. NPDC052042 TaxID=3365683 RepID=UPI0037D1414A
MSKSGRRRIYCDALCRRRAQRERDRIRRAAPVHRTDRAGDVAADIAVLGQELLSGQQRRLPLAVRLGQAQALQRDITCYVAAMMQDERAAGTSWAEIAATAQVKEASARACWSEAKMSALLANRPTHARNRPQASQQAAPLDWLFTRPAGRIQESASHLLRRYLTALRERSRTAPADVARQTGLPGDAVALFLDGELVASWPVTHMLVTVLGGNPETLRSVWETASGSAPGPWSQAEAARRLRDVLHVARLTADAPDGSRPFAGAGQSPGSAVAEEALDWPSTEQTCTRLGTPASIVRPFWDAWNLSAGRPA